MAPNIKNLTIVTGLTLMCILGYYMFSQNESVAAYTNQPLPKNTVKDVEPYSEKVIAQEPIIEEKNVMKEKTIPANQNNKPEIMVKDEEFIAQEQTQVPSIKKNTIRKRPNISLTIRMTINNAQLERIFCFNLRSTVLFWEKNMGEILFILDNDDEPKRFDKQLKEMGLPLNFRVVYEKDFIRRKHIEKIGEKQDRPYGYLRMYYSSFIQDLYLGEDDIVGWLDSDIIWTMPVTDASIFRDGKIIVKGINQLDYPHIQRWARNTKYILGVPMISDFMSFFPSPVYARTLRNCRNFIMRRFNATTFEEAYIKILEHDAYISAVNVIFPYAWHFEHDLYDWHLDISPETLDSYNKKYALPNRPIPESDTTPELHITVHYRHYNRKMTAIEISICYSQIALGMINIPHCDKYRDEFNTMLFEFQSQKTHVESWCGKGPKREYCQKIVDERYKQWVDYYHKNGLRYNTDYLEVTKDYALNRYSIKCFDIKYVNYP